MLGQLGEIKSQLMRGNEVKVMGQGDEGKGDGGRGLLRSGDLKQGNSQQLVQKVGDGKSSIQPAVVGVSNMVNSSSSDNKLQRCNQTYTFLSEKARDIAKKL